LLFNRPLQWNEDRTQLVLGGSPDTNESYQEFITTRTLWKSWLC